MYGQNFRLKAGHTEVMMRQKMFQVPEAKFGDVVFTYSDKQDGTYKNRKRRKMQEHGMSRRL